MSSSSKKPSDAHLDYETRNGSLLVSQIPLGRSKPSGLHDLSFPESHLPQAIITYGHHHLTQRVGSRCRYKATFSSYDVI